MSDFNEGSELAVQSPGGYWLQCDFRGHKVMIRADAEKVPIRQRRTKVDYAASHRQFRSLIELIHESFVPRSVNPEPMPRQIPLPVPKREQNVGDG